MLKHTFITLTVSLLIIGILSVLNPQPQTTEETTDPNTELYDANVAFDVEPELFVVSPFIIRQDVEEEVEEVKVEVEEVKTVTPTPKTEVRPAIKTETTTVVKEEPKEEPKTEEVKSEPAKTTTEEPKTEDPVKVVQTVSQTPAATWELEIVRLTNIERQKAGLSILTYRSSLDAGAKIRANEIVTHFSHTRPDGSRFFTVFGNNFQYKNIGENLASGFRTPEQVVKAWMNSDSHRANILNSNYKEISVAITQGDDGKYRWVQIFYRGR